MRSANGASVGTAALVALIYSGAGAGFSGDLTGVNVTVGLPFFRTSVDHGTAFDLAGTGEADPASLRTVIDLASRLTGAEERS